MHPKNFIIKPSYSFITCIPRQILHQLNIFVIRGFLVTFLTFGIVVRMFLSYSFDIDVLLSEIGFGTENKPNLVNEKIWLLSYASTFDKNASVEQEELNLTIKILQTLRSIVLKFTPTMEMRDESENFYIATKYVFDS